MKSVSNEKQILKANVQPWNFYLIISESEFITNKENTVYRVHKAEMEQKLKTKAT